jgi:hypothetical protein
MTFIAAIGHAQILDAREAGLQATHQALNKLEPPRPFWELSLPHIVLTRKW